VTLDSHQLLELRAGDGLLTDAERATLGDVLPWSPIRAQLTRALLPDRSPDLARDVMAALALDASTDTVSDLLGGGTHPELAGDVLAALELDTDTAQIGDLLRDTPAAPDLVADVMAALAAAPAATPAAALEGEHAADTAEALSGGFAEEFDVGVALRAAVEVPDVDLTDAVMGALRDELDDADAVGPTLRSVFRAPEMDLADDVMARLSLATDAGPALSPALRDVLRAPDVAHDPQPILDAVGVRDDHAELRGLLGEALDAGPVPDLADDVMSALGLSELGLSELGLSETGVGLRDALTPDEGPDLWAGIAAEIGAAPDVEAAPAASAEVIPLRSSRWALTGLALAIAAALLLFVTGGPIPETDDAEVYELASVNQVEIEEISGDAEVVVLQFAEGEPTIIFIEEEPAPSSDSEGG